MDYNVIYDFCKVRNNGTAMANGTEDYPPRVKFLIDLIEKLGIDYEIDTFKYKNNNLHNIYLKGSSDKWVMAHHDVCNHKIDNANDNSASVINAIGLKTIRPDINIALVDGEEPPCFGAGSSHFGEKWKNGELNVSWLLNLELSGIGGENFFIGNYDTDITKKIKEKFGCATMNVPFNDAAILIQRANMNAALINPCPLKELWVVKQVGISGGDSKEDPEVTDLKIRNNEKNIRFLQDKAMDIEDELFELEEDPDLHSERIGKLEQELDKIASQINYLLDETDRLYDGSFGRDKKYKVGDTLSEKEYKSKMEELGEDHLNLPDTDPNKFVCELTVPNVPKGEMPKLDQMDTSILYRCHTKDDHVGHIKTEDMKNFVEKVLTVICDL